MEIWPLVSALKHPVVPVVEKSVAFRMASDRHSEKKYVVVPTVADDGTCTLNDVPPGAFSAGDGFTYPFPPPPPVVKGLAFEDVAVPEQSLELNSLRLPAAIVTAVLASLGDRPARTRMSPSVNVHVAVPDCGPLAVTVYVATNHSGSWNWTPNVPSSAPVTSFS